MEFHERIRRYVLWRIELPASLPFDDGTAMRLIPRVIDATLSLEEALRSGSIAGDCRIHDLSGFWCSIGQTVDRNIVNHKVHGIMHLVEKEKVWQERLMVGLTVDQLVQAAKVLRPLERSILILGFRRYG